MLGSTVKLQHTQGLKHGRAYLKRTRPTYGVITKVYAEGMVCIDEGLDVWSVTKSKDSKAEYETTDS